MSYYVFVIYVFANLKGSIDEERCNHFDLFDDGADWMRHLSVRGCFWVRSKHRHFCAERGLPKQVRDQFKRLASQVLECVFMAW